MDTAADPAADEAGARLLAQATLQAPGFTLRGGTNEILQGVVARGLTMTPQTETARGSTGLGCLSALAVRSPTARLPACPRPTEIPQVRTATAFPTGFPQTKRHSPAYAGTPANLAP